MLTLVFLEPRHYSCCHWLLLIWVTISRCAHYVTVSLPDSLMPPHSPQKSYFHRLHTMWLLFFVISEAHLHVHLLSSSPPLPPLHLLGVGLNPTRIVCGTFIMIPDCRLRPVSTSQADKPEVECPTFSNNPNCHPLLSIFKHCFVSRGCCCLE